MNMALVTVPESYGYKHRCQSAGRILIPHTMQYFLERMALDHDPRNLIPDDYLRVSGYTIIPPPKNKATFPRIGCQEDIADKPAASRYIMPTY